MAAQMQLEVILAGNRLANRKRKAEIVSVLSKVFSLD